MNEVNITKHLKDVAVTSYEFSCDWKRAREAVIDEAIDEFDMRMTVHQVDFIMVEAQLAWNCVKAEARKFAKEAA